MKVPKFFANVTRAAFCALLFAAAPQALGQAKFEVDKPEFDDLQSPDVGGNTGRKNFSPKDWLEMEVKFKIDQLASKADYADQVSITWYVAVKNPEGKGFWLLRKQVNHVNVPVGEDMYASVYLSPNAVKRLSGSERASKGVVDRIGGEIEIDGTKKQFVSKGKPFWETSSKSISRSDKVPLLNKSETPFKFLWWDRYAEIKER